MIIFLQSVTDQFCRFFWHILSYKVQQLTLLQSLAGCYYKVHQVLQTVADCYYKVYQVLQSVTVITKWDVAKMCASTKKPELCVFLSYSPRFEILSLYFLLFKSSSRSQVIAYTFTMWSSNFLFSFKMKPVNFKWRQQGFWRCISSYYRSSLNILQSMKYLNLSLN